MRKIISNNGITLIALVITIIVLLILAGITINLTIGEQGIFKVTRKAVKNYINAEAQELSRLDEFENKINEIIDSTEEEYTRELTSEERNAMMDNNIKELNEDEISNQNLKNKEIIKAVLEGEVPIPIGFNYVTGTKNTGLVIKNNNDGNEFVWVPTENSEYEYSRYAFSYDGWNYSQVMKDIDEETNSYNIERSNETGYYYTEKMPQDEQESINKYKGYFIARYEAGIKKETKIESINQEESVKELEQKYGKPVFQNDKYVYNYVSKKQSEELSEGLYNQDKDRVISKLCSSYAWDTALKFIETRYSNWATDSIGENYENIETIKTGYHSVNNIYDMGGNVREWTTEKLSYEKFPLVNRGGFIGASEDFQKAAYRGGRVIEEGNKVTGFRIALFIK